MDGERRLTSQIEDAGEERTGRAGWRMEGALKSQIENAWEEKMRVGGWRWNSNSRLKTQWNRGLGEGGGGASKDLNFN